MNSLTALAVLLPLVLALFAAPAALLAGAVKPRYAAPVGAVFAALAALATLWVWGVGGAVDVPWSPTYDLRFAVELDGLAVLYALLATEIDFAVLGYSSRYLPLHWSTGEGPNLTARASIFHTACCGVSCCFLWGPWWGSRWHKTSSWFSCSETSWPSLRTV
jgi:NADH:ubiquinone oxidoreductase subunit 5 (subunit L)/multisubunit Na+/H+ antiporter MnhA subunit